MKYFRLLDNLTIPRNRWFLGEINFDGEFDFWKFVTSGEVPTPKKPLFINLQKSGQPLDFTMAAFELLIVNERTAGLFNNNDVQLFPINIKSVTATGKFYLMTIKHEYDCVDENLSVFDKFLVDDSIRPDKAGEYKGIYKLVLRKDFKTTNSIFRIKGYDVAIIISDELKQTLTENRISGIKFEDT